MQIKAGVGGRIRIATPNILGGGPVVGALITIASHTIAANGASLLTKLGLSAKSREVLSPDGINVRLLGGR